MKPSGAAGASPRIAHLITHSGLFGGAQRNTLLTVTGLLRRGWDVELVCGEGPRLVGAARAAGAAVHVVHDLRRPVAPVRDARAVVRLCHLFRQRRYTVVHTHSTKAGLIGRVAARAVGVPIVVHTVHGYPFPMTGLKATVYGRVEGAVARLTDRVVCVGEVLRREVADWRMAPAAKLVTIYSGVDFRTLQPREAPDETRRRLGLAGAWPIVGSVGQLVTAKAHHVLIETVALLADRFPRLRLVLVGEGPRRPVLQRLIADRGLGTRVALLGERDDVAEILQILDVYGLSSIHEGVGRALTEAMYAARPIVATPVNGVPELIQHGATGLLVAPGNSGAFAAAIDTLVRDPALAQRLGAAARRAVVDRMDADRMIAQLEELYAELLPTTFSRPPALAGQAA